MMNLVLVLVACTLLCYTVFGFPANEYEFSIRRDSLKESERIFEGKITNLTEVTDYELTIGRFIFHKFLLILASTNKK